MSIKNTLIEKLKNKTAEIAVLGLGYVGLPLAVVFGEAGFKVTGIDPYAAKVDSLNKGQSYIPDVKTEVVAKLIKAGLLTATTDFSILKNMDAVSISVPTPLRKTGDPDLSVVVGGITENCSDVATTWYEQALDTMVRVSTAEVAEMTKLLENTFETMALQIYPELNKNQIERVAQVIKAFYTEHAG